MQLTVYITQEDRTSLTRQLYKYGYSTYGVTVSQRHIRSSQRPNKPQYSRYIVDLLSDNHNDGTPVILEVEHPLWHGIVEDTRSNTLILEIPYLLKDAPHLPMFQLSSWDELITNIAKGKIHAKKNNFSIMAPRAEEQAQLQIDNLLKDHPGAAVYNLYMHLVHENDISTSIFPVLLPDQYYDARPPSNTPEWINLSLTGPLNSRTYQWTIGRGNLPRKYHRLLILDSDRDALLELGKHFHIMPARTSSFRIKEGAKLAVIIEALDHGLLRKKIQAD